MVERVTVGGVNSRVFAGGLSQGLIESLCKDISHVVNKLSFSPLQIFNGGVSGFLLCNELPLGPLQLFNRGVTRG